MKGLAEIARDNAPKKARRSIMVAINEARDKLKAAGVVVDSKALLAPPRNPAADALVRAFGEWQRSLETYPTDAEQATLYGSGHGGEVTVETTVRCRTCDGSGQRHLTEVERDTLASVDSTWTPTATVLANLGGPSVVKPTALINRLNDLFTLGLVVRQRRGKCLEWRRT